MEYFAEVVNGRVADIDILIDLCDEVGEEFYQSAKETQNWHWIYYDFDHRKLKEFQFEFLSK